MGASDAGAHLGRSENGQDVVPTHFKASGKYVTPMW
jgi:hypothetical protein